MATQSWLLGPFQRQHNAVWVTLGEWFLHRQCSGRPDTDKPRREVTKKKNSWQRMGWTRLQPSSPNVKLGFFSFISLTALTTASKKPGEPTYPVHNTRMTHTCTWTWMSKITLDTIWKPAEIATHCRPLESMLYNNFVEEAVACRNKEKGVICVNLNWSDQDNGSIDIHMHHLLHQHA